MSELPFGNSQPIFIYGAGKTGKDVYQVLHSRGFRVAGFLDRGALHGAKWEGLPIYPPTEEAIPASQRQRTAVIVAVHNRLGDTGAIMRLLERQGYGRIVTLVELYAHFASELGERYWLTSPDAYTPWEKEIEAGAQVWADGASLDLYQALLRLRRSGDYLALPEPDLAHQYFPTDIPAWAAPLSLIDCGAFDGDTLRALLAAGYEIQRAALFEPDPEPFQRLAQTVTEIGLEHAGLWPCAVYSGTQLVRFSSRQGESSRMSEGGDGFVQAVALDDVLPTFKPNLIKMDIEGAEVEGLLGARKLIAKHRPGLAVCVYHAPQHLWQIPLLLKGWNLGYSFYLRSHGYNGFETVGYAIPGDGSKP